MISHWEWNAPDEQPDRRQPAQYGDRQFRKVNGEWQRRRQTHPNRKGWGPWCRLELTTTKTPTRWGGNVKWKWIPLKDKTIG